MLLTILALGLSNNDPSVSNQRVLRCDYCNSQYGTCPHTSFEKCSFCGGAIIPGHENDHNHTNKSSSN
jgi:hypothetical protein